MPDFLTCGQKCVRNIMNTFLKLTFSGQFYTIALLSFRSTQMGQVWTFSLIPVESSPCEL